MKEAINLLLALCPVNGVLPTGIDLQTRKVLVLALHDHISKDSGFMPQWLDDEYKSVPIGEIRAKNRDDVVKAYLGSISELGGGKNGVV